MTAGFGTTAERLADETARLEWLRADLAPDMQAAIDGYLTEPRVRLGAIAEMLGVRVLLSTLSRGTSGQIGDDNGGFVIRVNRHESRPRQRFVLAHMLAHYMLHRDMILADGGWSENVLLRSGRRPESVEYEANRLAFSLVVPPAQLADVAAKFGGIDAPDATENIAHRFGVPKTIIEILKRGAARDGSQ